MNDKLTMCRGCEYELEPLTGHEKEPVRRSHEEGYCRMCHWDMIPERHETRALIAGLTAKVERLRNRTKILEDVGDKLEGQVGILGVRVGDKDMDGCKKVYAACVKICDEAQAALEDAS